MAEMHENCSICGSIDEPFLDHRSTEIHRFNLLLFEWANYRRSMVRNRHGIEITANNTQFMEVIHSTDEDANRGRYITTILEENLDGLDSGIAYSFTIRNIRNSQNMLLMNCDTLHPLSNFEVEDLNGILNGGNYAELEPGAVYNIKIKFNAHSIGEFRMSIAFLFQDKESTKRFTIAREIVIHVVNNHSNEAFARMISPYRGTEWINIHYVPGVNLRQETEYPIPREFRYILMSGLQAKYFIGQDLINCQMIREWFQTGCIESNYARFFHYLLWVDEQGAVLKIQRYNMEEVPAVIIQNNFIEINVPGLAEKRPSLVAGDEINIKLHNHNIAYIGVIRRVLNESIWISKINPEFISYINKQPQRTVIVDVKFVIGRLSYVRMHRAVDYCCCEDKMQLLFARQAVVNGPISGIERFTNNLIESNEEQKQAVINIVRRSSGKSPFIVYGPPGTGKTITIVEAIVQITKMDPSSKILICAPANAACDMLTLKLSEYFNTETLIRIHSDVCDWSSVPEVVRKYSNRNENEAVRHTVEELSKYQIVVSTLVLIGRYANKFSRTHVFIDEAAQAKEPEAIIAVGGILEPGGQLVLAGDHKQLGPLSNSKVAEGFGLGISLLERLMTKFNQYEPITENSRYIIKLKLNYRSHEQIIHIPNKLFYDRELQAVSTAAINDNINKIDLQVTTKKNFRACAIEFYGTSGQEEREGCSPSYFNKSEIRVVMKYVEKLIRGNNQHLTLAKPEDIGIIAPYIRQVWRIKHCLQKANIQGIEVGTTETFQGREKRIIIISTVRARADLLLYDKQYDLGFVKNDQRFNVAITRAMSKLIIIGNPYVLCTAQQTWLPLIRYCQSLGSYRGCIFVERNMETINTILNKFQIVRMRDDQYNN